LQRAADLPSAGIHLDRALRLIQRHTRHAAEPCAAAQGRARRAPWEDRMSTFMMSLNWTEQGIKGIKDSPKRAQAARELAKSLGAEIKQVWMTSGDTDLVLFVDAESSDSIAKFALALGSKGNVRTRTVRAWSQDEYMKMISELP
jgi:uncharacterized protein with GYD domain